MPPKKTATKTKGKKGKKAKKKVDKNLTGDAAEAAKKELVSALMAKCNMSEDQVLAAYDVFYAKYPGGEITQVCVKSFPHLHLNYVLNQILDNFPERVC